MPLVHELKFGAINQLSRYLFIQVYTFTKSFYTKGGLYIYPLISSLLKCIKHKSKHNKIEISLFE